MPASPSTTRGSRRARQLPAPAPLQLQLRDCLPALGLLLAALLSALLVIQSTHQCRELHATLQQLEARRWALDEEYTRLLLQHGTLAAHHRIEQAAEDVLHMRAPTHEQRRVFLP